MSFSLLSSPILRSLISCAAIAAGTTRLHAQTPDANSPDPSSHGPAGVMADHLHSAGEVMLGYAFMAMPMSGLRSGTAVISDHHVGMQGFTMAPRSMDMTMHMAHLMYAPTDWLTLAVMAHHQRMAMEMVVLGGGGHGGHAGHSGHMAMPGDIHRHATEGWGDTTFAALFPLWHKGDHLLIAQAGVSAPTGDVGIQNADGTFTHYGMQLGSGTWDALPGLTYTGRSGPVSWGAQANLALRLEAANDSGYQRGNVTRVTGWVARRVTAATSVSARFAYRHEGHVTGHYHGPHNHSSPPDLQANYGGEWLEAGIGLNVAIQDGALRGHRIGIEVVVPIRQEVSGIQLSRDPALNLNWAKAF